MPNDQSKSRTIIATALTSAVVIALFVYLLANWDQVSRLLTARPQLLLVTFAFSNLRVVLGGWISLLLLRGVGTRIGFGECFWLASITGAGNMLLPLQTGTAIRAVYLKRKHRLGFSEFLPTLIGGQITLAMVTALTALISLLILWPAEADRLYMLAVVICAGILVGGVVLAGIPPIRNQREHWLNERIGLFSSSWRRIRSKRMLLGQVAVVCVLARLCEATSFWFACAASGLEVSPWSSVAISSVAAIGGLINLTPGGIGVYEAMLCLVSKSAGLTTVQALTVAMLCRAVNLLRTALLGSLGTWRLAIDHSSVAADSHYEDTQA